MSKLPEKWISARLDAIAHVEMGQSPPSRFYNRGGLGLPFFQGKAEFGALYPGVSKWCTEPTKIAENGDILLSVRAPVGPTNLSNQDCCIGRGLAAIRAYAPIHQKYLLYQFRHMEPWLTEQGTGTTFKAISGGFLKGLDLVLAPLNEQKRIADKLDAVLAGVDTCRERLDRVSDILKRFRQAVLAAATSGDLTEEWRGESQLANAWSTVPLESVARDFSYGSSSKSARSGAVPVLRMGNIQDGALDWGDLVYTSDPKEISKYSLSAGDVLFNRTNSPALVGKTATYHGERPAIYAGYLIRVRCTGRLLPDYLNYCLNSPTGRDYCWQVKSDGVSQSNINAKKVAAFPIALPSVAEQKEIVHRVETLFAYADRLETRYAAARAQVERLTPALLAKAFRSELVPQDPNDEPASVLLERIRAARAAAPAKPKRRRGAALQESSEDNVEPVVAAHRS